MKYHGFALALLVLAGTGAVAAVSLPSQASALHVAAHAPQFAVPPQPSAWVPHDFES